MSENNQVILDTSQAKVALAELEARLKSLDKAMGGVSASALIGEYKKLSAGASEMAASIAKLEAARGTSVRSMQRYRETLASTLTTIGQLKSSSSALSATLAKQGSATDNSKSAMVSYRAVINGLSYSFREAGKYSQDYVKGLAVQKAAAKEQEGMLAGMYKMRDNYQKLGRTQSIAEQMDLRRTTALQKAAAAEQNDMLAGMYKMKESYQKLGRQWSLAEQMDLRRTTALQKAAAAEQNDMLAGMYKMKESYQKLGRMQSIAEQMDLRRTTALQKAAASEQADMLAGMYKMRDSYRAMEQKRDVELNNIRQAQAVRYRAINEKRDLEEYTMRQAHLKRMEMLERRWLEAGPRGQASQAMRARRLLDAGMDPSKHYSAQAIAAAKSLKETDNLTTALGKMGHAYRAGGGHAQAFSESQHAVHSALRGVSGALGALWLTYGKYVAVMAAASAATIAASKSFKDGVELSYQARFAAILQEDGPAPEEVTQNIRKRLIEVTDGTKFNALEAAEGLRVLAQTGVKAQDGLNMLNTVMAATIFGETNMETATKGLTDAMYNFSLMTDNAAQNTENVKRVGDAMAYVSVQTKAGMDDVAESFKNMTGLAQRYGLTIEEAAVVLERVGKRGLVGGNAGTLVRNMFEDLLGAPNNRAAAKIRELLGMDMFVKGRDNPLQYLQMVIEKYRELGAAQKQQFDANMLNERGRRPFSVLIEDLTSLQEGLDKANEKSAGLLDRLVSGLDGDVKTAFQSAGSALENAFMAAFSGSEQSLLSLAKTMEDVFRSDGFRDGLKSMVNGLADLAKWLIENEDWLKKMAAAYLTLKAGGMIVNVANDIFTMGKAVSGMGSAASTTAGVLGTLGRGIGELGAKLAANSAVLTFIRFLAMNPLVAAGGMAAASAAYIAYKDIGTPVKSNEGMLIKGPTYDQYKSDARKDIGLSGDTDISTLGKDETAKALEASNKRYKDVMGTAAWQREHIPTFKYIEEDNKALRARAKALDEVAAAQAKVDGPKVIDKTDPIDIGTPFPLGGNGGRGRVDRTPMKEVESASKLANAEYEQALASIEFYKKGLDLRKNARMVGEKEYQDTLDALAELEIQKGIDREDAIQKAISASLGKAKDPAMREDLVGRMAESLQKEQELTTKAYTDKALAQLKAQISQKEFLREIERVESESFSNRLSAQEQFVKEWNAKNGELLQRAMVDGDMESFIRLKNAEANGKEVARRSDATELAGMFPDNNEVQMAALEARYLAERERMLALTKENLDLQHQLEMDLTSRYQMELSQLRLQGVQNFMTAGEQITSAMAGLASSIAGEQSEAYRVMFAASKAFAVAKATMDMYTAISAAMAVGGPLGWAQIGPIMASMSALIGQISSISYSGAYDKGGIIPSGKWGIVGEYGPEIVQGPANVTSREKTAELLRGSGRGDATPAAPANVNVRNINVLDPKLVGDYLGTDDGEKLIMNVIQRNRTALST